MITPWESGLVLFTDGRDTVGGADLDRLLRQCREDRVVIHCLGLKTRELDPDLLQRLARDTGGGYFEASRPEDLVEQYRRAAQMVRRHLYRLVITPDLQPGSLPGRIPLEVRVGGANAVSTSTTLSLEAPPPSIPAEDPR